jgi:hypothetical protein
MVRSPLWFYQTRVIHPMEGCVCARQYNRSFTFRLHYRQSHSHSSLQLTFF